MKRRLSNVEASIVRKKRKIHQDKNIVLLSTKLEPFPNEFIKEILKIIIHYGPLDWLGVSKKCQQLAFSELLSDPRIVNMSTADCNNALINACAQGHAEVAKLLLKHERIDPSSCDNQALINACWAGQTVVVQELLKDSRVNPTTQKHLALSVTCYKGHYEVFQVLLKDNRINKKTFLHQRFIVMAASQGHIQIFIAFYEMFKKGTHTMMEAKQAASHGGYSEIVKLCNGRLKVTLEERSKAINLQDIANSLLEVTHFFLRELKNNNADYMFDQSALPGSKVMDKNFVWLAGTREDDVLEDLCRWSRKNISLTDMKKLIHQLCLTGRAKQGFEVFNGARYVAFSISLLKELHSLACKERIVPQKQAMTKPTLITNFELSMPSGK